MTPFYESFDFSFWNALLRKLFHLLVLRKKFSTWPLPPLKALEKLQSLFSLSSSIVFYCHCKMFLLLNKLWKKRNLFFNHFCPILPDVDFIYLNANTFFLFIFRPASYLFRLCQVNCITFCFQLGNINLSNPLILFQNQPSRGVL